MNSIGADCNELKKQYDACFNSWFSERFLKGDTDDTPCQSIFKVYQHCVKEALKVHNLEFQELEKDHLGDPAREFKKPTDKDGGKSPAS